MTGKRLDGRPRNAPEHCNSCGHARSYHLPLCHERTCHCVAFKPKGERTSEEEAMAECCFVLQYIDVGVGGQGIPEYCGLSKYDHEQRPDLDHAFVPKGDRQEGSG